MRVAGLVLALAAAGRAAETAFARSLAPADFTAAGLNKLSAAELDRLESLVQHYARAAAAAVGTPGDIRADPQPQAARPERVAGSPGGGRKVRVAPGTEIEYGVIESRIAGNFSGWEPRTVFTLENGQRWQTDPTSSYVTPPVKNPGVKIEPGMLGSFWMTIEGVRTRVKVAPVGSR